MPRRSIFPALQATLLLAFLALALSGERHDAVTVDEFAIVPAGYAKAIHGVAANWLSPVNPPLVQIALALPLRLTRCVFPRDWLLHPATEFRWTAGRLFQRANHDDYRRLFTLARLVSIAFSMALLLVIHRWAREIHGEGGALIALALGCFSPTLLAHGHLATVDVGFAAFLFLAFYFQWRGHRDRTNSLKWKILFSLALAAALGSKFTALFFLPLFVAFSLIHKPYSLRRAALHGAFYAAVSLLTINALYHGEGFAKPLGSFETKSGALSFLRSEPLASFPSPLPEWYIRGIDTEASRIEERRNLFFYRGEVTSGKSASYFAAAYFWKTPLSTILLVSAGLFLTAARPDTDKLRIVAAPLFLFLLFSLFIGANLGIRYVLPALPFLFVLAGGVWPFVSRRRAGRIAAGTLVALTALSAIAAAPRFISYFNIAAEGSRNGWRLLSDSNVDWGQDLGDLAAVMKERGIEEVFLSRFGLADPALYGIRYRPLGEYRGKGTIAISAHHLNGITPFEKVGAPMVMALRKAEPFARAGDSIFLFRNVVPVR